MAAGVAVPGEGPAEAVNDAGHGIQAVEPALALRDHGAGIVDGGSKRPELDEERDEIADVAIERVQSGKPQADAEDSENGEQQEERDETEWSQRGLNAVEKT